MSLNRFSNIDEIHDTKGLSRGIVWKQPDIESLVLSEMKVIPPETPIVEMHVYTPTADRYLTSGEISDFVVTSDKLYVNYAKALHSLGISRGFFRIEINVLKEVFGGSEDRILQIKEISPDRREVQLAIIPSDTPSADNEVYITSYLEKYSNALNADLAINFGENQIYKIIGQKEWVNLNDFVIRLYQPLPPDIQLNTRLWIVEELTDPYIDEINLTAVDPGSDINILKGPNFEIDTGYNTITETDFKSWNDLLDVNLSTSQKIIDKYFSGSLSGASLGIDYTGFDNFVYYSSAKERLANFKYKLQLIEYYDDQINILDGALGSDTGSLQGNIAVNRSRKDNIIGGFDNFENWLYNENTSSLTTHGISGSFIGVDGYSLTPWPKYISGSYGTGTYRLHHTTSSIADDWYTGFSKSGSLYDDNNEYSLVKTIPAHIRDDNNNDQYELFVNMLGQHFDILWSYITALTKIYKPEEQPKLGIDKDILVSVAKSMGWELANGKQASQLWQYALGVNVSGSYASTGSIFSESDEAITGEVWRRIVNNLPYLLKSKGTSRSIKALMNMYGIPQTLLSIREYGGPKVSNQWPVLIEDRYSYAIDFDSGSNISYSSVHVSSSIGDWGFKKGNNVIPPTTREFRFKPYVTQSMILYSHISSSGDSLAHIAVEHTGSYSGSGEYGRVVLSYGNAFGSANEPMTASSDWVPIYNGEFWNLRYYYSTTGIHYNTGSNNDTTYNVQVQHSSDYVTGKVLHSSSLSITPTSSVDSHYLSWSNPDTFAENVIHIAGASSSRDNRNVDTYLSKSLGGTMPPVFSGSMQEYREWMEGLNKITFDIHTKNPTSYVSSLSPTSSYDTLVRQYTLGSETKGVDLSTNGTIISSSHPNQSVTDFTGKSVGSTNATSRGFLTPVNTERGNFIPVEETYYVDGASLGGNNPKSEKIRFEDNSLIRMLSPVGTSERSSFDLMPVDSNKLGLFYSFADQVNKDIYNQTGRVELDDYVGDPNDEFEVAYNDLIQFSKDYWKKFTNTSDINSFIRIFSQFDFALFHQIKQLLPERVDEVTGLLIEPNILERSKVTLTKRPGITNPQYDALIPKTWPTASADANLQYSASIEKPLNIASSSVVTEYVGAYSSGPGSGSTNYCDIDIFPVDEAPEVSGSVPRSAFNIAGFVTEPTLTGGLNWTLESGETFPDGLINDETTVILETTLEGSFPTNSGYSKQVRMQWDTWTQYDVRYNFPIDIGSRTDNNQGTGSLAVHLVNLETPEHVESNITEIIQSKIISLDPGTTNTEIIFEDVLVPAYTNLTTVFQVFQPLGVLTPDPAPETGWKFRVFRLGKQILKVCHAPTQPMVTECRISDIYKKVIDHYSGSNINDNLIMQNGVHAFSQSLGMAYSSSLGDACYRDDFPVNTQNLFYNGCQLVGPGINIPSLVSAIDNKPVIEVFETNPNQIIYSSTPSQKGPGNSLDPGNIIIR